MITGDWQLAPSSEKYVCVRQTVTTDTYISLIEPIAPLGTHHTVLMVSAPDAPDGTVDCQSTLVKPAIYASGVGTQPLQLPTGIAIHLVPGQQLLLNLHLFNATDNMLSGTSGIRVITLDPSAVQHEAGVVLAGKAAGLDVEPGATTQTGTCTTNAGSTVIAAAPHMHLLGTHLSAVYTPPSGAPTTLLDQDYSFDQQRYQLMSPMLTTVANGKLTVTCSYFNPTGTPVYFGESTTDEMCFALTMVYPPPPVDECTK